MTPNLGAPLDTNQHELQNTTITETRFRNNINMTQKAKVTDLVANMGRFSCLLQNNYYIHCSLDLEKSVVKSVYVVFTVGPDQNSSRQMGVSELNLAHQKPYGVNFFFASLACSIMHKANFAKFLWPSSIIIIEDAHRNLAKFALCTMEHDLHHVLPKVDIVYIICSTWVGSTALSTFGSTWQISGPAQGKGNNIQRN